MQEIRSKVSFAISALVLGTALLAGGSSGQAAASVKHAAVSKGSAAITYPLSVKDDTGRTVVLLHQPKRILSLTLGTDEMLLSLVPLKTLVGVDYTSLDPTYSHIYNRVKQAHIATMGNAKTGAPSVETILAARPDLVLVADYVNQNLVRQLQNAGIPVYEFSTFNSFSDIESHILILGKLVGEPVKADALVAQMKRQLAALAKSAPKRKLTVLYYSWGYVAGSNTTANDVIAAAGGVNVAAKLNGWDQVSNEQIMALNPDVIVVPDDSGAAQSELKQFLATPAFQALRAVKEHHVYTASDADLSDVAQFAPLGVKDVQQMLLSASSGK